MCRIHSVKNLKKAVHKSQLGKKKKYGCIKYNKHRKENFLALKEMLVNGTFHTSPYKTFTIRADQGKLRDISKLPYFPDRIVHHAIVNVIEPRRVRSFIRDTFCCIKGRGLMDGTNRLQRALRRYPDATKFCLKIDLKKFFPSVTPAIMSREFHRLYKDKAFLALMDDIIFSTPKGLPIGSLTSQLMSNVYLSPLDHYVKDQLGVKFYYRYCDDIVVLSDHKGYLKWILREIKKFASERLNLVVKDTVQLFEVEKVGIDFLGYRFYHKHRLLRKSIKKQFCRYMKRAMTPQRKQEVLAAYKEWCQHGNCRRLWFLQTGLKTYQLPSQLQSPKPTQTTTQCQSASASSRAIKRRRAYFARLDECEDIMISAINHARLSYYTDIV